MPQVQKQVPPSAPVKRASGSVLSKAIAVGDLPNSFIKLCIYGKNRVGKTTLSCQFEKPALLISFEPAQSGGARSVKRVKDVDYIRLTNSQEAFQLTEELRADTRYKTHIIDTVTSMQDVILQEIIGKPLPAQLDWGMISQDEYRNRSSKTKELLRPFLAQNANTILLGQLKDHNREGRGKPKMVQDRDLNVESFFSVALGGETAGWLFDACDYMGYLYLDKEVREWTETVKLPGPGNKTKEVLKEEETGEIVRKLRTREHPNFASGFRSELGLETGMIPEFIEAKTPQEMHKKIMDVIGGIKLVRGK